MKKGVFCISIDTELLWGRKNNLVLFIPKAKKERAVIKKLLILFKKYSVQATWAIVGNLFLESNSKIKNDQLWHTKNLIQLIINAKDQEIACHSYTHPEFTSISEEMADRELKQCVREAKKFNIKLKSFVFPRNKVKHLTVLKNNGFLNYRGLSPYKNKFHKLIDLFIPVGHSSVVSKNKGIYEIPATMYYLSTRGLRKYLPIKLRVIKAKLGINNAIKFGKLFHLWFHPTDLVDHPQKTLSGLEEIIKYASLKRDADQLEIKTMEDIVTTGHL